MEIRDAHGVQLREVVVKLSSDEVTELLVGASQMDDGSKDHAFIRDPDGSTFVVYAGDEEVPPLEKGTDWWLGPLILLTVLLVLIGAFTVAKGVVALLF